ncbi:permease [Enterococcus florum]|uniref:Permease n=1 Tax=Enterococcus florum TaxID=2480627 RepID=A0A4P5PAL8_9ENTE|nr:ABC transporter permease [Enterococcus florum]GCF93028.1 permease [Enterococcus florum]
MLVKLSLNGIKSRLRDYLVLFSGLLTAAAIFYMFESIASNKSFLESNSLISSIVIIFHFGSVLLGIITLVYILYANGFLMSMRQKEYGMFMMLGANAQKIAQMIFVETFLIGFLATLFGSTVGIGLTTLVYRLLTEQLGMTVTHYAPVSGKAFLITTLFFAVLFLITAVMNASSITKKTLLILLKEDQTPVQVKRKGIFLLGETLLGLIFLSIGYFMMKQIVTFQLIGIGVALVTIVLGTYFFFHSVIIFGLSLLKQIDRIAFKQLNNFTLSQLSFRMQEYTRMLSMIAMLVALALGALTVGIGFRNEIPKMADAVTPYDLVLNNAQKIDQQKINQLQPTTNARYHQKEDEQSVYYVKEEFDQNPLIGHEYHQVGTYTKKKFTGTKLSKNSTAQDALREVELPEQKGKEIQFLSRTEFNALPQEEMVLQLIQVKRFIAQLTPLKQLAAENGRNNPSVLDDAGMSGLNQKTAAYQAYNTLFSGFEFMGFFLGLAFLAMLASCLMFKILSGAQKDAVRYEMLNKIGARRNLLRRSMAKEIGVLFLAPAILGTVHVLFGLKMFAGLLSRPYHQLWIPFGIFFLLYFLYYTLTVWMYRTLVLK